MLGKTGRAGTLSRKAPIGTKKPRRWTCKHGCQPLNDPGRLRCRTCGIGRDTTRTSLRSRADTLWRELIAGSWRDGTRKPCRRCGDQGHEIEAAHIIKRSVLSTRFDPINGIPLCVGPGSNLCHFTFDSYGFDREEFIESVIGREKYAALRRRATKKFDGDYARVIRELKDQLAAAKEAQP